jgi:hypothetical protein
MVRHLNYLFYLSKDWLKSQMGSLFPANDDDVLRIVMRGPDKEDKVAA